MFEQEKDLIYLKNNLIKLYNFNEIKGKIAEDNLSLRIWNFFYDAFYVLMLYILEHEYDVTQVELIIPTYNAIIKVLTMIINNNLNEMAYNEDDLLSKVRRERQKL